MDNPINITSIESLHERLENHTDSSLKNREFTMNLRKSLEGISEESLKQKITWECNVHDFELSEGLVTPVIANTKEDGTSLWIYPTYDNFNKEGYSYLRDRASNAKSDFLIARYNQVLWNSPAPHKHEKYAKSAVDAYLRILGKPNSAKKEETKGNDYLRIFKNGFSLSLKVKYRIDEYKKLAHLMLFKRGQLNPGLKVPLLNFMLESPQLKKADFEGTLTLINRLGKAKEQSKPSYFGPKLIYETGLKIAQKCGTDTKIWHKRIGDVIVKAAENRMDDETRMVPLEFYREAILYYKKAGLERKVKQIEQRYFLLKDELKLSKIEAPLSRKNAELLNKSIDDTVSKLLTHNPEAIIDYLLRGKNIFPDMKTLIGMGKDRENAFKDFAVSLRFDRNKNISKDDGQKEKREKYKIYENYDFLMRLSTVPFLHRLFIEGIKQRKLTFEHLANFFLKNTWLGQDLSERDSAGDETIFKWIGIIAPSLLDYFMQTESALKSANPYTNYILPIDSLTLKFEGVLRDFAKIIGVSTSVSKREVLREKYIEELLAEEKIKNHFNEDDLLFFNYLFVAKEGMNLRNNIAHSFYRFDDYSFHIMHLLICAFLRIGKYKITKTKKA